MARSCLLVAALTVACFPSSAQRAGAHAAVQDSPPASSGLASVAAGKPEEALPALEGELARSPDDPKVGLARAQGLMNLARRKKGLAAGQALLASFPDDADIRTMVGEALFESFRPLEAVETWRPLLADPKEGERALSRMLAGLLSQRRFEDGRKLVAEAQARGIAFDDAALSLAAQTCGCPERLTFLEELVRRHPSETSLDENLKVESGVCEKGGTSTVVHAPLPGAVSTSLFHPNLRVLLNGKISADLGIDTGSQSVMFFSRRLAKRLGLTVLGGATFAGLGWRGTVTSEKVLLGRLEFGPLRVTNLPATLAQPATVDPHHLGTQSVRMGLGPFLDTDVEWDVRNGRCTFWPAGTRPETVCGRAPDVVLPVLWFRGIPLVPVSVNGKGPYPFLLDTGAGNSLLAARYCPLLGLTPGRGPYYARSPGHGSSGEFAVGYTENVTLSRGERNEALPWVETASIPQTFSCPVFGILGQDILLAYRIIFDGPGCRIYMLRYSGDSHRASMTDWTPSYLSRQLLNCGPPAQKEVVD